MQKNKNSFQAFGHAKYYYNKLNNKARALVIAVLVTLLCAPVTRIALGPSNNVTLEPNTHYYGNYSVDGFLVSTSSGKSFEYFPSNSVFTNKYYIKHGNEVWSDAGIKVAKISKYHSGRISIHHCKNDNIRVFLGHTWTPD